MYALALCCGAAQNKIMSDGSHPEDRQLYRLVYVSQAREGLGDNDIADILNTAQSINDERFVTGFLAHNGDGFMQILEGPVDEVREIYERIVVDERHHSVQQLIGEDIDLRAFPNWSMNYHRVDGPPGSSMMIARNDDTVDGLMTGVTDRALLTLFSRFLRMRRAEIY